MLNRIFPINYCRDCIRHLFTIAVSVFVFCSAGTTVKAVEQELTDSRISYSSVNKPLKEFLKSIELQTSTIVHVDTEWNLRPVSLNLKNVTVEEGLKSAFKQLGLSYALTFDVKGNAVQFYIPSTSSFVTEDRKIRSDKTFLASSQESSVVSQEEAAELKIENAAGDDYLDLSAVPPDDTSEPVLTEREILQLRKTRILENVDTSLVPEDVDESFVPTEE